MSNSVSIHFVCEGREYSFVLKPEEITLSMLQARIRKKLRLDETTVEMNLCYFPLLVGYVKKWNIGEDDDLHAYLHNIDKDNRRCLLHVELLRAELPEQLSRAGKGSSFGVNYEEVHSKDDENGANVMVPYAGNIQAEEQHEAMEEDDDTRDEENVSRDEDMDNDRSDMHDHFVDSAPVVEGSQYTEAWEDGLSVTVGDEFRNKKEVQDLVDRAAFVNSFGFKIAKSDKVRYVLKCREDSCTWCFRAAKIGKTDIWSIRTYNKMHTCSRASQSSSNQKRKGTPRLVASLLNEDYPGKMDTPTPKTIMHIVQSKIGLQVSYSTALRGKNDHLNELRGSQEDSYKMLYCYLYMLESVNPGTITSVKLDGNGKFLYLFIALGACIEGFQCMRKVITVDATHLKNGYPGVLVFAAAQDPNRHNYPIAFGVLDGENNDSWTWFFEMFKSIVPDSSELVFMSDRNPSLITAVGNVYPSAHHAYCIWHLSQNVKGHASKVNKDVVAWRFMECSKLYTVAEFEHNYTKFQIRYPSVAKYLEETTKGRKESWARCYFPGERYNIDTSNCVESLNNTFRDARKISLIPMLDEIVKKIAVWFNAHRKEAVAGSAEHKLVPLVENKLHDTWKDAEKLHVMELNSFELRYNVTDAAGKPFAVNLLLKTCSCRVFDIEKYPCIHAVSAFIHFSKHKVDGDRDIQLHDLCSRYYWVEQWQLAYYRTIYLVPDKSEWIVPDYIKELKIIPLERLKKKGRRKDLRFPGSGEKRPRTKNKRRKRQGIYWMVFEEDASV